MSTPPSFSSFNCLFLLQLLLHLLPLPPSSPSPALPTLPPPHLSLAILISSFSSSSLARNLTKWRGPRSYSLLNIQQLSCSRDELGGDSWSQVRSGEVRSHRSALSDLGLIADLFEKNALNWFSFCLKSLLFDLISTKSLIVTRLVFHTKQKYTQKSP